MSDFSVTSSTDSTETSEMALSNPKIFPNCDPDESTFKIKDYFLDLESYFVILKIDNANQKQSFLQLSLNKKTIYSVRPILSRRIL